ncbi:hypothetical protein HRbin41_01191 [bacterium HR41]|nr:hypothetical protein HRbin41_01191 [bacterium HR41]
MRKHVEATTVGHAEHDLARPVVSRQLDRLVEHRHDHVETLDRELLLAEERAAQVLLERFDLGEPFKKLPLVLGRERLAEASRLDRLSQPHALAVLGDVLDLVGDRAAVGLAQVRQRVGEGFAGHGDTQDPRRDLLHQLGGEVDGRWVERRVADGLGAERVETRGQVPVHAVRLDDRRRRLHRLHQRLVGHLRCGRLDRCRHGLVGGHGRLALRRLVGQLDP